jgi:hypothetical protein
VDAAIPDMPASNTAANLAAIRRASETDRDPAIETMSPARHLQFIGVSADTGSSS